tara:strand:+ start:63977 stop:68101 length:4125 start_codon:yes stop_codon:yes gene_type:complete
VIPEDLKPWKEWVLKDYGHRLCPSAWNQPNNHFCEWPAYLKLDIQSQKGSFAQSGILFDDGWVYLVGDQENWPVEVKSNETPLSVVVRRNTPAVYLSKGEYNITGQMAWNGIPEKISVPKSVGVIQLSMNSKNVSDMNRDPKGFLWLKKSPKTKTPTVQNTMSMKVFRKLSDSIPQESYLLMRLYVTGMDREESIGPVVMENTLPIQIHSPLPAKLEDNGQLKLQVRAGQWDIYVKSRYLTQQNSFALPLLPKPWPETEVWSFESENSLRRVDVSGAQVLDPTQTDMPDNWKNLPSYLMKPETTLLLKEKHRGKAQDRGESLALYRQIWMDFDGQGLTVQDQLSGVVEQDWRLSTQPPMTLGQVDINGEPQLITVLEDDSNIESQPGVEIRNGHLNLSATSRLQNKANSFPAVGWQRDVQSLKAVLHLPPGWKLFHAMGVDKVSDAWLRDWNLLDLFSVLFISLAMIKLLGIGWGVLGFATLTLTYHEPGAPLWSWLAVLTTMALARALPQGTARTLLSSAYFGSLALLVLLAIPFIGKQIQTALYPQLSHADSVVQPYSRQPVTQKMMADDSVALGGAAGVMLEAASAPIKKMSRKLTQPLAEQEAELKNYDPNSKVQTGPGLPRWSWQTIQLSWQGPVMQDQNLSLWLIPAWLVSLLKYLQVILVMVLIYGLMKSFKKLDFDSKLFSRIISPGQAAQDLKGSAKSLLLPFLLVLSLPWGIEKAHADIPDQTTLNELRNYLLTPAECFPDCADFSKSQITIDDQQLSLRVKINALEQVAVPLPHSSEGWGLQQVLLDDQPAHALKTDDQGKLWLLVEKGQHEIIMLGSVAQQTQFSLSFAHDLKPKYLKVDANGWTVNGIIDEKLTGQSIQFNKKLNVDTNSAVQKLTLSDMPDFVTYTRKIQLGLDWKVYHEIVRVAPKNSAIHLKLPLLEGEKILSPHVKVKDGQAQVQLAYRQKRVSWYSELPIQPSIELKALSSTRVKELWSLQSIPKWHVDYSGIPLIHQQSQVGQWMPQWAPWGNEKLIINITKPEAIAGNTLTIDETRYRVSPGLRKSSHTLDIKIKSSQGTQHAISLPKDSKLKDVHIDNVSQPLSLEGEQLIFPIHPGEQNLKVQWQSPKVLGAQYTPDSISLNSEATNNFININLSKDRWILYLKGPELGPVVQYWAVVILMLILACILGLSKRTPLATWQWILLGLGVTLSTPIAAIVVVLWFVVMQIRNQYGAQLQVIHFQLLQGFLALLTLMFILAIVNCISTGLLGNPQMQLASPISNLIRSNFWANNAYELAWYQDKVLNDLPRILVISVPMFVYRILMLLWALWLAFSLIKWFQWGWQCYISGGIWKRDLDDGTDNQSEEQSKINNPNSSSDDSWTR